jgi:hypothetical protein
VLRAAKDPRQAVEMLRAAPKLGRDENDALTLRTLRMDLKLAPLSCTAGAKDTLLPAPAMKLFKLPIRSSDCISH